MSTAFEQTMVPPAHNGNYIALRTPDQVLLDIVNQLGPKYSFDAAALDVISNILNNAIVTPQLPSVASLDSSDSNESSEIKVKHTENQHPYVRSERSTPEYTHNTSAHGEAPYYRYPKSPDQSFYLHHEDPLFPQLLPKVDRSRYYKPKLVKILNPSKSRSRYPAKTATLLHSATLAQLKSEKSDPASLLIAGHTVLEQKKVDREREISNDGVETGNVSQVAISVDPLSPWGLGVIGDTSDDTSSDPLRDLIQVNVEAAVDIDAPSSRSSKGQVKKTNAEDTVDDTQIDPIFFQIIDSSPSTQITDSQIQEDPITDTLVRGKPEPAQVRRSRRLAKTQSVPHTYSSAPSSFSLGKRSRGSNDAEDRSMRKKMKAPRSQA